MLTQVLVHAQERNIKCPFYRVPDHGIFIAKKGCIARTSRENCGAQNNDKTNTVHNEFLKHVVGKQNVHATDIP
jgi:hypothetical protein